MNIYTNKQHKRNKYSKYEEIANIDTIDLVVYISLTKSSPFSEVQLLDIASLALVYLQS